MWRFFYAHTNKKVARYTGLLNIHPFWKIKISKIFFAQKKNTHKNRAHTNKNFGLIPEKNAQKNQRLKIAHIRLFISYTINSTLKAKKSLYGAKFGSHIYSRSIFYPQKAINGSYFSFYAINDDILTLKIKVAICSILRLLKSVIGVPSSRDFHNQKSSSK